MAIPNLLDTLEAEAIHIERQLYAAGLHSFLLYGDNVRMPSTRISASPSPTGSTISAVSARSPG